MNAFELLTSLVLLQSQGAVRYEATIRDVKYVYGPAEPVARLRSGDILETNTLDAFGNAIQKPGDSLSMVKGDNPLTGPFYVEGAEPGDALAVTILELKVDSHQGVGGLAPGFGALNKTAYTPMLNPDLPEKIWFYSIDNAANVATYKANDSNFSVKIPMKPFFGCIGVAPPGGESRMSITPGEWGGNMDAPEASVGNTVYLPVNVDSGDPQYRSFLLEQARRHLEKLPESSGIAIDRMDWLTRYNPNADDGVSWIDGPSRHLRRSWMALLEELGPLMHGAGKVIFANDMDRRLELMKHVDGFFDEHGDYPFNLNASAFLALRKPLVCWTRGDESLKPDPDRYFQRNLYLGAFPMVPYPGNDHSVLPDEWNERQYLDYGHLFNALRGRKWVVKPGVARIEGGDAKVNVFETKTNTVVFVGLAGGLDRVKLTLRGLGKEARVLFPGESEEATLQATATDGDPIFDVPLRRRCAMLILAKR